MSTSPPPPTSSTSISQTHATAADTSQSHEDSTTAKSTTADASTNAPTMPPTPFLTLILAATPNLGIGKAGALPWPMLKKEMGYFARVTKRVAPASTTTTEGAGEGKQRVNAVIMGRKTWDSIPPKFRPLRGRLNVVLTQNPGAMREQLGLAKSNSGSAEGKVEGPLIASGILDALAQLSSPSAHLSNVAISRIFIIGGASLYRTALELPQTKRILLTQIRKDYDCDTFFPLNLQETQTWRRVRRSEIEEWTGEQITEGGEREVVNGEEVGFEFSMWERVE